MIAPPRHFTTHYYHSTYVDGILYTVSMYSLSVRFFVDKFFLACVGQWGADWERMKKYFAGGRGGESLRMIVFIIYLFAFMW